ncbi:hypothetical protein KY289_030427 [Solanum tuberosum]|nr:hypothetical protein KY289_030427 [Solanum tuberosum]
MLQYKRKRTGTSSSNPNAKENAESLTAARKRGTTTLQSIGGQPSGEEKSDQSSDDQSSEMEKNSKNNSDLSGEEKSDENSNENSSEEKKDGESHGDESSREEQSEESESEQSDEKEEEGIESSPPMHEALTSFEMDGDILKYYKGEMPYPYGRKWNEAKRIYTVMNIKNTHFIALEFLMERA